MDVVRVFVDDEGHYGNPLGLIRSTARTSGLEQDLAARLGYSETVFIDEVVPADGSAAIRIFTPAAELPFAGHPSVGTAWWLARAGTPVTTLHERAGAVDVRYEGDLTWITARSDWAPEFVWHRFETPAEVEALDSATYDDHHHYAYAWIEERPGRLRSRMFAPGMGMVEDEATGSAAVRVTALLGRDLDIHQGCGSRITTRLRPDGTVLVGGRTVCDPGRRFAI